jgi:hypothetical protein
LENAEALDLFPSFSLDLVESLQTVSAIALSVSDVANYTEESLVIGGTSVALSENDTQITYEDTLINVSVTHASDGTVMVAISPATNANIALNAGLTQRLLQSLQYSNIAQEFAQNSARTVSIISITERDTNQVFALSQTDLARDIALVALDEAPVFSAQGGERLFTSGDAGTTLFPSVQLDFVDASQSLTSFTFTVSQNSNAYDEALSSAGGTINLSTPANSTLDIDGAIYSVTHSVNSAGDDQFVLNHVSGTALSESDATAFIESLRYTNSSDVSTIISRTFTVTQVVDSGLASGDNKNTTDVLTQTNNAVLYNQVELLIEPLNEAPLITIAQTPYSTLSNVDLVFSDLRIADSTDTTVTVEFTVGDSAAGALTIASNVTNGIVSADVTQINAYTVLVSAVSIEQLNATLAAGGLVFAPASDYSSISQGGVELSIVATDPRGAVTNDGQFVIVTPASLPSNETVTGLLEDTVANVSLGAGQFIFGTFD